MNIKTNKQKGKKVKPFTVDRIPREKSEEVKRLTESYRLKQGIKGLEEVLKQYSETNNLIKESKGDFILGIGKVTEMRYALKELKKRIK